MGGREVHLLYFSFSVSVHMASEWDTHSSARDGRVNLLISENPLSLSSALLSERDKQPQLIYHLTKRMLFMLLPLLKLPVC